MLRLKPEHCLTGLIDGRKQLEDGQVRSYPLPGIALRSHGRVRLSVSEDRVGCDPNPIE